MPEHIPRKEDNSASSCNSTFSNRDGDKEGKLTDCSFKYIKNESLQGIRNIVKNLNSFITWLYIKNNTQVHWRVHQGETLTSKLQLCRFLLKWLDFTRKFCRTSANVTIPLEFERFWLNVLGLHSFQFTKFCIANGLFHSKPPVLSKINYFWLLWCLKSPWSLWSTSRLCCHSRQYYYYLLYASDV